MARVQPLLRRSDEADISSRFEGYLRLLIKGNKISESSTRSHVAMVDLALEFLVSLRGVPPRLLDAKFPPNLIV